MRAEIERLEAISFADRPSASELQDLALPRRQGRDRVAGLLRALLHGLQDLPRELRREVGPALERGADGATSSAGAECLSTKPDAPASSARRAKRHVPVHGEKHHGHPVAALPQLHQRVDAVEVGHGDVGDDDVRPQPPGRLDQRAPVFHHADQVELGGEQALQRLGHQEMVVGKEHARSARRRHGAFLRPDPGTQAMIAVPWPGALSMSSVPFTSRTRSRMLARPRLHPLSPAVPDRSRRRRHGRRGAGRRPSAAA